MKEGSEGDRINSGRVALDPELPPGNSIATGDYSVVAERRA